MWCWWCFISVLLVVSWFMPPVFLPQEFCLQNIQPIRRCLRATRSGSAALFREWQNLTLCGWKMERSCTAPTRCSSQWESSTGRRFTGSSDQHAQSQQYHPQHQPSLSKKIKTFWVKALTAFSAEALHCQNARAEFLWELKQEVICWRGVKPAESGNNQQLVRNLRINCQSQFVKVKLVLHPVYSVSQWRFWSQLCHYGLVIHSLC